MWMKNKKQQNAKYKKVKFEKQKHLIINRMFAALSVIILG